MTSSTEPAFVTLISEDNYRFIVDYPTAITSRTIKTMLSSEDGGGFVESESHTAKLQIRGEVLEKVIEYLHWYAKYSNTSNEIDIPDFKNRIPPEISLELYMAADFLDV